MLVGRGGVEPPTFHFSGGRSYQLSYLPKRTKLYNTAPRSPNRLRSPTAEARRKATAHISDHESTMRYDDCETDGPA